MIRMKLISITNQEAVISWDPLPGSESYRIYWSDRNVPGALYQLLDELPALANTYVLKKSTHRPHYLKVVPVMNQVEQQCMEIVTPVHYFRKEQLEVLQRGLTAVPCTEGIFLSWRLFLQEVITCNKINNGMSGVDFVVYRDGKKIAQVSDSTNFLDRQGSKASLYSVSPCLDGVIFDACTPVKVWDREYLDIPLKKPEGGTTPAGENYTYSANDMSVADVDGDGEYEYIVKWDPSNSHDVSIKGYTGQCLLDCYKLDGQLLWRLDMGPNIRAGAHYTQFICYDFNGDGKAEMAVKTAPGTRMTIYDAYGEIKEEHFITMPIADVRVGYSYRDNYVCSADDYYEHLTDMFWHWHEQPEVQSGQWPATLEECFGTETKYRYPLSRTDAEHLVDYFLDVYAPERSEKNKLREFEGFIYKGPEYLTMFGGDGREIQTIPFPFARVDDGLRWGDYAMKRIEPCNRVDRFLSGVAYLDGERPYLIICRGYYTRTAIAAFDFFDDCFHQTWVVDSGFVPMDNPFNANPHIHEGTDPVYGKLAGQGNHSLSTADVDGDGCMEIIYGAACIDHDGSLLYSSYDYLPDGTLAKMGHGDAMHVADINPQRPGLEIFNVFEGAEAAPYGFALRRAEDGKAVWGQYAEEDLGRCMIGDMVSGVSGLQCWVNHVGIFDYNGNLLDTKSPGTNMSVRWAADMSTQVTDGEDYLKETAIGRINDLRHGCMLIPEDTLTNNGTKGNPCLVADVFGDFREEILLRTKDSSAIRIYTNTEITSHKLFTLMHDTQYRCGVAWQNNCYNQPCYTSFYLASDMSFDQVLPHMNRKPVIYLAGDSILQTYDNACRPQAGWGEMLMKALDPDDSLICRHRADSPFSQQMCYENQKFIVDNCAMAGRSSRTFREEGRLEDIRKHLKPGDYLLIQFGHNDAAENKPERYVSSDMFEESLKAYVETAKEKQAVPVLLSSVSIFLNDENENAETAEIGGQLPEYARVMKNFAEKENVFYIDMGLLTKKVCLAAGRKTVSRWYMDDHVHLTTEGATVFADIAAKELKKVIFGGKHQRSGDWQ